MVSMKESHLTNSLDSYAVLRLLSFFASWHSIVKLVNFRFTKLVWWKIWRYRRTIWFKVLLELWNCCIHRICSEHWYRIFPRFFTFWLQILLVLIFHLIKAKNSRLKSSLNLNLNVYVGDKIQKNDTPFLPPKYL